MQALAHLGAGIGNVVFATPLLVALGEMGFTVDVRLSADYEQTADLLRGWSLLREVFTDSTAPRTQRVQYDAILPAIPPFYWGRFRHLYRGKPHCIPRPPDSLFYENEQAYYLAFAHSLGFPQDRRPEISLPIGPVHDHHRASATVLLAPGSKTGEMAAKRWPWFERLAALLPDVAVIGTADDLSSADRGKLSFPPHVQNFAGRLSLRETAELIASAGLVVANDTGLAYVAAAVGAPTIILFGPTPHGSLGPLPAHVTVLRSGLPCEPCWFGSRFTHCQRRIDCLRSLEVERALAEINHTLALP
jgi:ADP-heptose:LPS heptosyltransferase